MNVGKKFVVTLSVMGSGTQGGITTMPTVEILSTEIGVSMCVTLRQKNARVD